MQIPLDSDSQTRDAVSAAAAAAAPQLLDLGEEILILVAMYLDLSSLRAFLETNRCVHRIQQNHGEFLWKSKILRHYGTMMPSMASNDTTPKCLRSSPWKDLAKLLHHGIGEYHGFALDQFTSNFEPYPMHLTVVSTLKEGNHHSLRWRTLKDSLTRVHISSKTRNDASKLLDSLLFSEVELLRGRDILVPNHYQGWYCGPAIIGVYPGGSFFLLRKEAMTDRHAFLQDASSSSSGSSVDFQNPHPQHHTLKVGTIFAGAVTMELEYFFQTYTRHPKPVSVVLELIVDGIAAPTNVSDDTEIDAMSSGSSNTYNGHIVVSNDRGERFQIDSLITVDSGKHHHRGSNPCDVFVKVGTNVVRPGDEHSSTTTISPSRNSVLQFFLSSKFYGWFQGDCLVGLLKDKSHIRTGSFFLKLNNRETNNNNLSFITPGIKDHLAPSLLKDHFPTTSFLTRRSFPTRPASMRTYLRALIPEPSS